MDRIVNIHNPEFQYPDMSAPTLCPTSHMVWWHRGDMLYTLYQLQYRERSAVFTTARSVVQTRQGVRKLGVMNIYDSVHIGMQLERR